MILTEKEKAIIKVALTELDLRLRKGLANSNLHEETGKLWSETLAHESCVSDLIGKL